MSEVDTATTKGDPIVQYCAICGVEYDERMISNRWFKCDSCQTILQIKTRTEFKLNSEED